MGSSNSRAVFKKMSKFYNDSLNEAVENSRIAFGFFASDVAERASKMAPVLTGDLETSIIAEEGDSNDEVVEYIVGVDDNSGASEYAKTVHENVDPGGEWKLGPKSAEKNAASNDLVGGLFLERAVLQESEKLSSDLDDAIRSAFK